jgi:hypothetical protein
LVERLLCTQEVSGSNPLTSTEIDRFRAERMERGFSNSS